MEIEDQALAEEFSIPSTYSMSEQGRRTLKAGDMFGVFDYHGDIYRVQKSPDGLYHLDTRHLSRMELSINGHRPLLLSSSLDDDNAMLVADLANPDIYHEGSLQLVREMLYMTRSKFLWRGVCYERIAISNFDQNTHRVRLALRFAADFADLFEARGMPRVRRGKLSVERPLSDAVIFRYRGLDDKERVTRIDFSPTPTEMSDHMASFDLELVPHKHKTLLVTVRCDNERTKAGEFFSSLREAREASHLMATRTATITTSNALMNEALSRSTADLHMLLTDTPHGAYPYAGVPWFSAPFGRDGIITAMQTMWLDPAIAKGALRFLAATQAQTKDEEADAEPGKILHEMRRGEMANTHEVPFGMYYGSVDSTPLFVLLAGMYFEQTGDSETIRDLWPNIVAALNWMDLYGDADKDGFIEYQARGRNSLVNQGWKDSGESISHADGTLAQGSIALCEVQAYAYAAKVTASAMAGALNYEDMARALERQARELKEHFEAAFWCDELGTYALALDGQKNRCAVRSSNAGHALFAGIASPGHADRIATTLFSREGFSGWGVRTLASSERRFNPMSYHNGSIWPHDNAMIALGLGRYAHKAEAVRIFQALFEATQYMDVSRLPELFCGFKRRQNKGPTLYPVACSPQAWASGAPFMLLQACLGVSCHHTKREICFDRPMLPPFLDEVRISNMRLRDASLDLILQRHGNEVSVNVVRRHGDARVVVIH
jgi:glycogen debranching enzyme